MNKRDEGDSGSSEGGIRVSDDPVLDAPGLMECGDTYVPALRRTHSASASGQSDDKDTLMGDQAIYDEDDLGSAPTITSR